jgi:hypothetical protein
MYFSNSTPENTPCVLSQSRARQGNLLGPLLFTLALQGPLEHMDNTHQQASILALHDGDTLQGPPDILIAPVQSLHKAALPVRSHFALRKCAICVSET